MTVPSKKTMKSRNSPLCCRRFDLLRREVCLCRPDQASGQRFANDCASLPAIKYEIEVTYLKQNKKWNRKWKTNLLFGGHFAYPIYKSSTLAAQKPLPLDAFRGNLQWLFARGGNGWQPSCQAVFGDTPWSWVGQSFDDFLKGRTKLVHLYRKG